MLGVKTIIHAHITVSFFRRRKKKETLLPLERVTRKIRETKIFVLDVRAITLATRTARPNNLRQLLDDIYVLISFTQGSNLFESESPA